MSLRGKLRGAKHSLNRLKYCEKKKWTEIFSQAGPNKPSFGFQINTPLKKLKKLAKNEKKRQVCAVSYVGIFSVFVVF